MKKLRVLLQYNIFFIVLVIISLTYSLCCIYLVKSNSIYNINDTRVNGYINKIKIDGNKLSIELYGKENLICNYYFKDLDEKNNFINKYNLGDEIEVIGVFKKPNNNTVFNLFNYKKYLKSKSIYFTVDIEKINKIKANTKIRYKLKQLILDRINNIGLSKKYLYAFILGDTFYINNKVKDSYQLNGISHLFAVSGTNISLITVLILKLLDKYKYKNFIVYSIVLFYMFLTDFSPSIIRSGIFFVLLSINKSNKLNIKTINILLLTLFISLLFDPYLLINVGFQFSFIISMYLIIFNDLIKKYKSGIKTLFIVSFISFLSSMPIVISSFYQLNFLSILLNIIFVPFVSFILFPLSMITFILPILDKLMYLFINILETTSLYFSNIKSFTFIFGNIPLLLIFLYYLLITLSLNNKKYYILLILILFINYNKNLFIRYPSITFIDVGQGDSILISLPNNKGNILVDTGGVMSYINEDWSIRNNTFSIGKDVVSQYIKSMGIKKLDYLILTHGDYDHLGEIINIIDNIKVDNICFNSGNINSNEKVIINYIKNINYKFIKEGDIIELSNYKFYILNSINKTDENKDSSIIYFVLNNKKILLMGDSGVEEEKKLTDKYNLSIDLLKVGHHGSDTSTSDTFLNSIKPKYAVITVGLNNKFKHPSNIVLNRLKTNDVNTYLTSINGSIKFIFKNKLKILTSPP